MSEIKREGGGGGGGGGGGEKSSGRGTVVTVMQVHKVDENGNVERRNNKPRKKRNHTKTKILSPRLKESGGITSGGSENEKEENNTNTTKVQKEGSEGENGSPNERASMKSSKSDTKLTLDETKNDKQTDDTNTNNSKDVAISASPPPVPAVAKPTPTTTTTATTKKRRGTTEKGSSSSSNNKESTESASPTSTKRSSNKEDDTTPTTTTTATTNNHKPQQLTLRSTGGFGGFANKILGGMSNLTKKPTAPSPNQEKRTPPQPRSGEEGTNSAPDKDKYKSQKKIIEIESLEALPKDLLRQIKQAGINLQTVGADDDRALILLNCLHFLTKNQFIYTPPGDHGKKQLTVGRKRKKKSYRLEKFPTEVTLIGGPEIKRELKIQEVTGEGGFGRVYLAKTLKPMMFGGTIEALKKNDRVAVKKMKHGPDDKMKYRNFKEVMCLKSLTAGQSLNIVKYYNSYLIDDDIWVMMEFMEGGSLAEAIKGYGPFEEAAVAYVAKEMLAGIKFLHDRNLAHRDLKSANIMMTIEGDIKLIDFGLCVKLKPPNNKKKKKKNPKME